ncbi:MAG: hypothetical protein IPP58_02295 [Holophagaceae bacterium]|uniref:Uncharacterized protein n=1 Tax=Candidatus Geothrix skivensis TaxID=2954439 RepID=A0A9D7SDG1_9BACT|nr:hypothetical protein [Candidatus Geothrix skivensis]
MTEDLSPLQPPEYRYLVGVGCLDCRHLIDLVESTCEAFPGGIPLDILQDRVRHDAHYPGDRGIHFEKV